MTQSSISIMGYRWLERGVADQRNALLYQQQFGVNNLTAHIASQRDLGDQPANYFSPTLRACLPNPMHLLDMDKGIARIARAIIKQEKITIFGDYDVDGATSTAVLLRYFADLGIGADFYIPDRLQEGYGPNCEAFAKIAANGTKLIITVDCGITSHQPILEAKNHQVDVIVIDHHMSTTHLPEAVAVINPNRYDEQSPHQYLAGVGVTYLTVVALNGYLLKQGYSKLPQQHLLNYLDLVALGTVCDVVPLRGANRAFVTQGIKILRNRNNLGLKALADVNMLEEPPDTYHLGYVLGPCINAGGRIGNSSLGVRLLSADYEHEAIAIAKELRQLNSKRQEIEKQSLDEAKQQISDQADTHTMALSAGSEHWHKGVIGIVAGRIKDDYAKPTAIFSYDKQRGVATGSLRSVSGISVGAIIQKAVHDGIAIAGGGHAMAGGISIKLEQMPLWQQFFNSCVSDAHTAETLNPTRFYDYQISEQELTLANIRNISKLAPFGVGNPKPQFIYCSHIEGVEVLKEQHLRCRLNNGRIAMAFRCMDNNLGKFLSKQPKGELNFLVSANIDSWLGRESLKLVINDVAI